MSETMKRACRAFSEQRLRSLLGLLFAGAVHADTLHGRVVRVDDGDTIAVLDQNNRQQKVRLTGIGAPEKCQPFYNVSRQPLVDLVFQKDIAISYKKFDRDGGRSAKSSSMIATSI